MRKLPIVARAKTLTGLLFQFFRMRWAALGKLGKVAVFAGLVLAGAAVLHFGACYLGACESASPCDAPCEIGTAPAEEAPCPYAARAAAEQAAAEEAAAGTEADVPPCRRGR